MVRAPTQRSQRGITAARARRWFCAVMDQVIGVSAANRRRRWRADRGRSPAAGSCRDDDRLADRADQRDGGGRRVARTDRRHHFRRGDTQSIRRGRRDDPVQGVARRARQIREGEKITPAQRVAGGQTAERHIAVVDGECGDLRRGSPEERALCVVDRAPAARLRHEEGGAPAEKQFDPCRDLVEVDIWVTPPGHAAPPEARCHGQR